MKDKVMLNNSQVKVKKTEVEDHHRISSIFNKTKSVTACNDSLKSRTLYVNAVCATCGKCVFNSNHDACVFKLLNDVNARTKKPKYGNLPREGPKPFAVRPSMKLGQRREMTSPSGFSTPPHIPNINTTERPPVTTIVFAATTPGNTLFAYRASTSTNPAPMISPDFIEANYEILKSLLRDRRRQIRNEDLRIELEYFSEDYDEELEMEPRPERTKEVTPPLCTRSPRVRRHHERVVGLKNLETGKEADLEGISRVTDL
ncbi:hypothetical protein Tco_1398303 [Tanacetum coccineum]